METRRSSTRRSSFCCRKVVSIWKSKRVECEFVCGQGGGQGELYSNNFLGGGTTELTLFSPMFRMDKYFVYHFLV